MAVSTPPRRWKKPSGVRPRSRSMKGSSAGSASDMMRFAEWASVRAIRMVGTPMTSAASRAELRVRTKVLVGTSTLPPRWPHFFSAAT
jgi:hypothetical protein